LEFYAIYLRLFLKIIQEFTIIAQTLRTQPTLTVTLYDLLKPLKDNYLKRKKIEV
jgi:hypothetical protein